MRTSHLFLPVLALFSFTISTVHASSTPSTQTLPPHLASYRHLVDVDKRQIRNADYESSGGSPPGPKPGSDVNPSSTTSASTTPTSAPPSKSNESPKGAKAQRRSNSDLEKRSSDATESVAKSSRLSTAHGLHNDTDHARLESSHTPRAPEEADDDWRQHDIHPNPEYISRKRARGEKWNKAYRGTIQQESEDSHYHTPTKSWTKQEAHVMRDWHKLRRGNILD